MSVPLGGIILFAVFSLRWICEKEQEQGSVFCKSSSRRNCGLGSLPGGCSSADTFTMNSLSSPSMLSSLLESSSVWSRKILIPVFLHAFILSVSFKHHEGYQGSSGILMVAGATDEESTLRDIFIDDIKKLLTHNQIFFRTYIYDDSAVNIAFDEAKIAANVIHLYPNIFDYKVNAISERIREALKKKEKDKDTLAVTADGVPVYFVDKGVILLGLSASAIRGGAVLFPE